MNPRVLGALALALLALIALSQSRSGPGPAVAVVPVADTAEVPAELAPYTVARVTRPPRVAPLPNALAPSGVGTSEIDLLAILAVRRRIAREGTTVYLDSLLAQTDSTVVRWPDRHGRALAVTFVPDTTLESWSEAFLTAARAGMAAWRNNAAGLRLEEVADPAAAEIVVQFVTSVSDSSEFGVTQLDWQAGGGANRATIRLAIRPVVDGPVLVPGVIARVAAHEFGHALGLPHSGSRNDLMYPSSPVASPSRRDQATLRLLYAVPPGTLRTP